VNASIPESKGACQRCGEHIAFPATMEGENVPCPHCGRETTLVASISPNLVRKVTYYSLETPNPATNVRPMFWIYLVAVLVPIVGFGLGLWLLGKKEGHHAAAVFIVSAAMVFLWVILKASGN
jgi:hypothetical protein